MTLDQIIKLAEHNAPQAWAPLNRWLERNVIRASDAELRRALALLDLLGRRVDTGSVAA
jgi:hypothetical protein